VIDLRGIRGWVEKAGYEGFGEVEIFSRENWRKRPGEEMLAPVSSATSASAEPVSASREAQGCRAGG